MNDLEKINHPAPFDVTHPHLKDFFAFLPELNKESDRGMALIATSFITNRPHYVAKRRLGRVDWKI